MTKQKTNTYCQAIYEAYDYLLRHYPEFIVIGGLGGSRSAPDRLSSRESAEEVVSCDRATGLFIKLAPRSLAHNKISFESEETKVSVIYLEPKLAVIDQWIKGSLLTNLRFLLGIPLDPPLARITEMNEGLFIEINICVRVN